MTPDIRVADTSYNAKAICDGIAGAAAQGAKIIVLPELCITGYTCGDLFLQEKLLCEAKKDAKADCVILPDLVLYERDAQGTQKATNSAHAFCPWLR